MYIQFWIWPSLAQNCQVYTCFHLNNFDAEPLFLSSLGGAATQRASSGAQEGAKRAATNSVMGVSLQVRWSEILYTTWITKSRVTLSRAQYMYVTVCSQNYNNFPKPLDIKYSFICGKWRHVHVHVCRVATGQEIVRGKKKNTSSRSGKLREFYFKSRKIDNLNKIWENRNNLRRLI